MLSPRWARAEFLVQVSAAPFARRSRLVVVMCLLRETMVRHIIFVTI